MTRAHVPTRTETELLLKSKRRCALCFGLHADLTVKQGQIAHLNKDSSNSKLENLVFLCLFHHNEFDTQTSQSKGIKRNEVKAYRDQLHKEVENLPVTSEETVEIFLDKNTQLLFMAAIGCKDRDQLEFQLKLIENTELKERLRSVWEFLQQPVPPELVSAAPTKDRVDLVIEDMACNDNGKSDVVQLLNLGKVAYENSDAKSKEKVLANINSRTLRELISFELQKP